MPGLARSRWAFVIGTTALAVVLGVVLWALLQPSRPKTADGPVSRIDIEPRACLATSSSSSPEETARAWDGLKGAARQDRQLVIQRFGAPTGATPATFLNTLAQLRCTVVVTVGVNLSDAAAALHGRAARFVAITAQAVQDPAIIDLPAATLTAERVTATILHAVGHS